MRPDVARDLSDSAYDFVRVVWPAIHKLVGEGDLLTVETEPGEMAHAFDTLAGIDAWQLCYADGAMRGIASRIQWGDRNWRTHTIRRERPTGTATELAKRQLALQKPGEGWLLPALTVQAYLTKPRRTGRLISVGIVRTRDLYKYAELYPCPEPRRNPDDGVLFDYYDWGAMRAAGVRVGEVPRPHGDRRAAA